MGAFAEQLKAAQGGRGSTNDVIVDDKKLQSLLLKLNSNAVDTATRRALMAGARILQKSTRKELRTKVKGTNKRKFPTWKTMQSGVKVSSAHDDIKVHIMGEFRLRLFELGTQGRERKFWSKEKGVRYKSGSFGTGKIEATHFFQTAQQVSSQRIFAQMDGMIGNEIDKLAR